MKPETCILHIGKTGGSALKQLVEAHRGRHEDCRIATFDHWHSLENIAVTRPEARIVFFVREPLSLFVSGFNSRLRCGRPRYDSPWSPREADFFGSFPRPIDLAEALSSAHDATRTMAVEAMNYIMHVRTCLKSYLTSCNVLERYKDRIFFIGSQDHYTDDVAVLRDRIGIDADIALPQDDLSTHRTPAGMSTELSALARENLTAWYARDIELYRWCMARRGVLLGAQADAQASFA